MPNSQEPQTEAGTTSSTETIDITPNYPALFRQMLEHGLRPALAQMRVSGRNDNLREVLAYVNICLSCAMDLLARAINAREDEPGGSPLRTAWVWLDQILNQNAGAGAGHLPVVSAILYRPCQHRGDHRPRPSPARQSI